MVSDGLTRPLGLPEVLAVKHDHVELPHYWLHIGGEEEMNKREEKKKKKMKERKKKK